MKILLVADKSRNFENSKSVIFFPTIKTVPLEFNLPDIKEFDTLIFTSQKAVNFFFKKINPGKLKEKTFITVGEKTASLLKRNGFKKIIIPEENTAEGIVNLLLKDIEKFKNKKILFPRSKHGRREIIDILNGKLDITPVDVYETKMNIPENKDEVEELLKQKQIDTLIFTSPLTFKNFVKIFGDRTEELLKGKRLVTIGKTTTKTVEDYGFSVFFQPKKADISNLIKELSKS